MIEKTAQSIVQAFSQTRQTLASDFLTSQQTDSYLKGHTLALEKALLDLADFHRLPCTIALIAVGGFARSELYPYSDIDLLILMPSELSQDDQLKNSIAQFVSSLWSLGLPVGASVRDENSFLEEAQKDITVATTYLESRLLFGNHSLFQSAKTIFFKQLNAEQFFSGKMLEFEQRHHKHGDTPYALEPNLKESPGGMRDLHVFSWCAQAAQLANSWVEMAQKQLITEQELHSIESSLQFLAKLRIHLHLIARRPENTLRFDLQEALAERCAFRATDTLRASEILMKNYYLNAKRVVQISLVQLQVISKGLFKTPEITPTPIDQTFQAIGEELDLVDDHALSRDPNALLRVFYLLNSSSDVKRMSTRLLRSLWHESFFIDDDFRNDAKNQATFLDILKMSRGCYHALKQMNNWGILGQFVTEFRPTVGQMQHDLFHLYTVDQHTLKTLRNIRRFARSDYAHEFPECSRIMGNLPNNWLLIVAALFHDIGKGQGGHHEIIGAQKVETFLTQYGFSPKDREFVVFLVRHHLLMSHTAQKEDISDPDVVTRFIHTVNSEDKLDALYLLSIADVRATNVKLWTPWKAQLFESLYLSAQAMLRGNDPSKIAQEHLMERQKDAIKLLTKRVNESDRLAFWDKLDVSYFMRHRTKEIVWHTLELAPLKENEKPVVKAKSSEKMGGLLVMFYVPDIKDLFLKAVAYFSHQGLSVTEARIHTTRHGWALDTFLVVDRFNHHEESELITLIESQLGDVLSGLTPLPAAPQGRLSRRSKTFPIRPKVLITPDESGKASLLSLTCTDRIGLLYAISEVLARYQINLETAKINTLEERAEDVFLITSPILQDEAKVLALETDLISAMSVPSK